MKIPSALNLAPKVFGCVAYVHVPREKRTKLEPCAIRCMFVGYGNHQKGYKCFDLETGKTYVTMDVTFLESESYFRNQQRLFPIQEKTNQVIWWEDEQGNTDRVDSDTDHTPGSTDRIEEDTNHVLGPEETRSEEEVIQSDEEQEIPRSSSLEDVTR